MYFLTTNEDGVVTCPGCGFTALTAAAEDATWITGQDAQHLASCAKIKFVVPVAFYLDGATVEVQAERGATRPTVTCVTAAEEPHEWVTFGPISTITVAGVEVPVVHERPTTGGRVKYSTLPPRERGTLFVVPQEVGQARHGRGDMLFPARPQFDPHGGLLGFAALSVPTFR